jgi:DNA-binding response OmpR family regulator
MSFHYHGGNKMEDQKGKVYKLLIVDDDQDLAMITKDMFEDYGYDVTLAKDSDEAYELMVHQPFELIILDINLPDGTGFEVCKELRRVSTVPVIFASARTSEDDKITGLDMGADDYIAKPYSLKELLSRTNSLIRRTYGFSGKGAQYDLGAGTNNVIHISIEDRCVTKNGKVISLSLKEFDVLAFLARHMNQALKKEDVIAQVWGTFSDVELATLTVHIRWLREKLENNPSEPDYIKTVWGIGYMLTDGGGISNEKK